MKPRVILLPSMVNEKFTMNALENRRLKVGESFGKPLIQKVSCLCCLSVLSWANKAAFCGTRGQNQLGLLHTKYPQANIGRGSIPRLYPGGEHIGRSPSGLRTSTRVQKNPRLGSRNITPILFAMQSIPVTLPT